MWFFFPSGKESLTIQKSTAENRPECRDLSALELVLKEERLLVFSHARHITVLFISTGLVRGLTMHRVE